MKPGVFLKAEWRKLALANYIVDPGLLQKHLPAKTELDFWNGRCYVSLVGFMFLNTKVLGIPVPFHRDFEEVNLRFYVRHREGGEWKRGVVFISEIVPKPAISLIANTLYGEHYKTLAMRHAWTEQEKLQVSYEWKLSGRWNRFSVDTLPHSMAFAEGSEEEFITQHFWGYTKLGPTKTSEYEVAHPAWQVYPVTGYDIDVNGEQFYGEALGEMLRQQPESVFLAEGSEILVRKGRRV